MVKKFSKLAKKGLDKFTSLKSSKSMKKYRKKWGKPTGGRYKEDFYEFVARSRLRRSPAKRWRI